MAEGTGMPRVGNPWEGPPPPPVPLPLPSDDCRLWQGPVGGMWNEAALTWPPERVARGHEKDTEKRSRGLKCGDGGGGGGGGGGDDEDDEDDGVYQVRLVNEFRGQRRSSGFIAFQCVAVCGSKVGIETLNRHCNL